MDGGIGILAQWFLPEFDSFIEWCLVSAVVAIVTVVSFLVTDTLFDFKSLIVLREFIRK